MTDDTDLEREFRDGLRRAADRADVGVRLAERAHAGVRTRRHRRWAVAGTVAAVVAVSGTAFALGTGSGDGPDAPSADRATTAPTFAPVTDWRAETWKGVTVDVPADWGWGTAPIRDLPGADQAFFCGAAGADVAPDGGQPAGSRKHTPWVGRPIMLSDACGYDAGWTPSAPYVWLGADIGPGSVDVGDGFTQETVEEFGTTLTVASQDPALRQQILDSARATTGCATSLDGPPSVLSMPTEGLRPVHAAQVCAYREMNDGVPFALVYATTLDESTAQELYSEGVGRGTAHCSGSPFEYVTITFSGTDAMGSAELTQDWIIDPGCHAMSFGGGAWMPLNQKGMALWSANGLQATLTAFIGMLG